MRECAPAASRFTGAAVVDNSFRQLLLRKLRAALSHTGLVLNWSDPAIDTIMLRDWETEIKPKFSGDATVFYIKVRPADLGIPLPHPLSLEFTRFVISRPTYVYLQTTRHYMRNGRLTTWQC